MKKMIQYIRLFSIMTGLIFATTINIPGNYDTIQAGLNAATEGDTVFVASGIYIENLTWPAINGIKLIGEDRNTTIIDGGSLESVVRFEEELNEVIDSTTVIRGITVQNGLANGRHPYNCGGGIYLRNSSPTLEDVTITGNSASYMGGGIFCFNSNPAIENLAITDNIAGNRGGGIYIRNSNLSLFYVTITSNSVEYFFGGGIYFENVSSTLEYVTIEGNSAYSGGGIYFNSDSNLALEHVTIMGNLATVAGGGIYFNSNPYSTLQYVTITENSAEAGGGIYFSESSPQLSNITINGNFSPHNGGGIYCNNSHPELSNIIINGNNSQNNGGGIFLNNSSPKLTNLTISGNISVYNGSGIYCLNNSNPVLVNTILWNDSQSEIAGSANIFYSNIQGGWEGEGNINADPLFVNPNNGNFTLQPNSPCIDAGSEFWILEGDTLVNMHPDEYIGDAPDLGAVEFDGSDMLMGDVNSDGDVNIIDVVMTVNYILSNDFNDFADLNSDGYVDVIDIVLIVNLILIG